MDPEAIQVLQTELDQLLPSPPPEKESEVSIKEETVKITLHDDRGPWNDCRRQFLGEQLFKAIRQGNISSVERRIAQGASLNTCCSRTKISALHYAVFLNHEQISRSLLAKGACSFQRDAEGRQPIHIAAALGNLHILNILLNNDSSLLNSQVLTDEGKAVEPVCVLIVDTDLCEDFSKLPEIIHGSTPLHISVERLHKSCADELLKRKAATDIKDSWSITPIHTIGRAGTKYKNFLNDRQNNSLVPLHGSDTCDNTSDTSSTFSYPDLGRQSSTKNVSIEVPEVAFEAVDMLKWLVTYGSDYFPQQELDSMETTCLHNAINNDDVAVIEYVTKQFGGDVLLARNKDGHTGLHLTAKLAKWELLNVLVETQLISKDQIKEIINVRDKRGRTALHLAARTGNLPAVSLLLAKGADPSILDNDGSSVLYFAAENPNVDVLEELLTKCPECKKLINLKNIDSEVPLWNSVSKGLLHTTCLLVEYGADVLYTLPGLPPWVEYLQFLSQLSPSMKQRLILEDGWADPGMITLLHLAALKGYQDILTLLLRDESVDQHFKSICWRGNTALHLAVMKGSIGCVEALLQAGFQVNKENLKKQTPLCLAVVTNRNDILQLLVKHEQPKVDSQVRLASFLAAFYGYADCLQTILQSQIQQPKHSLSSVRNLNVPWLSILDQGYEVSDHSFDNPECKLKINFGYFNTLSNLQSLKRIVEIYESEERENILLHPFIETFLHIKWKHLRHLVLLYIKIYVWFVLLLTTVGSLHYFIRCESPAFKITMHFLGVLSHVIKTSQDISQLRQMKKLGFWEDYWKSGETWLTWATDLLSLIVLLGPHPSPWLQYLSAVAVLLSWIEVLSLLSRWPSQVGSNIRMFFNVSKTMFQVLLPFTVVLLGFMFAFLISLRSRHPFDHLWSSLVKVLTMTVQLDSKTISRDIYGLNIESLVTGGILLTFLVLVNITLMNVLVGLAVSDIAELQKKSKVSRIADQIDLLSAAEALSLQLVFRMLYIIMCLKPGCSRCTRFWVCFCEPKPVTISPAMAKDEFGSFQLPQELRRRVIDYVAKLKEKEKKTM